MVVLKAETLLFRYDTVASLRVTWRLTSIRKGEWFRHSSITEGVKACQQDHGVSPLITWHVALCIHSAKTMPADITPCSTNRD